MSGGYGSGAWGGDGWGNGGEPLALPGPPPPPPDDFIIAYGTTPWVQLPTWPRGIVVGDVLELYEEHYNVVSREFEIVALERELRLIRISPELESNAQFTFQDGLSPPPFARIRVQRTYDFNALRRGLDAWLARPENQPQYLQQLDLALNQLVVNQNPTAADVRDLGVLLGRIAGWLTVAGQQASGALTSPPAGPADSLEAVLASYQVVPACQEVDALLASYRQRGADRAITTLLECRFQDFFGLSADGASTAGELLDQIRALARQQLPVSRYGRTTTGQQLLSSSPVPDPEYSREDVEPGLAVDPPLQ